MEFVSRVHPLCLGTKVPRRSVGNVMFVSIGKDWCACVNGPGFGDSRSLHAHVP